MKVPNTLTKTIRSAVAAKSIEETAKAMTNKGKERLTFYRLRPLFLLVFILSFIFAAISAITASSLEYDFALSLLGNSTLAIIISVAIFTLLALLQRYLLILIFEDINADGKVDFPGLIVGAVLISGTLIIMSFYGARQLVQITDQGPALEQAQVNDINLQIEAAMATIAAAKEMKNAKGEVYWHAQKTIRAQSDLLKQLNEEKARRVRMADQKNADLSKKHEVRIDRLGWNFGWVTVACELIIPLCIFFLAWYREQSRKEFEEFLKHSGTGTPNTIASRPNPQQPVRNGNGQATEIFGAGESPEMLKYKVVLNKCQRELANLKNRHGHPDTVRGRLENYHNELLRVLPKVNDQLSPLQQRSLENVMAAANEHLRDGISAN